MSESSLSMQYTDYLERLRRFLGFSARSVAQQAFTASAATDVITAAAHGFVNGNQVMVSTAGTLPAGLAASTIYFVTSATTNTLQVASVPGGTAIDITDAGTGTFYIFGENRATCEEMMDSGLRMFYGAADWSFLYQTTTLTTGTEYACTATAATDVIACSGHPFSDGDTVRFSTTVTLPGGLSSSTTYYVINSVAATSFKVSLTSGGSAVDITSTGTGSHTVRELTYLYDVADNMGAIIGTLHFAADDGYAPLKRVTPEMILEMRNESDDVDIPSWYAIRSKTVAQTTGQRFEFMLYPEPDDSYVLSYLYKIHPENLRATSSRNYPLGGEVHSETILEAMLAAAEKFRNEELGIHNAEYSRLLQISMFRDNENAANYIGKNLDAGSGVVIPGLPVSRFTEVTTYGSTTL